MENTQKEVNSDTQRSQASPGLRTHLIRACERYQDEYEQCQTSKSRRQQLFVHGNYLDCEPWGEDYKNCKKWVWDGDEEAARAIIENEEQRFNQRFTPHLNNKVWNKRVKPPEDWNKHLPEFEKLNEDSYLSAIEKNGEDSMSISKNCVIQ